MVRARAAAAVSLLEAVALLCFLWVVSPHDCLVSCGILELGHAILSVLAIGLIAVAIPVGLRGWATGVWLIAVFNLLLLAAWVTLIGWLLVGFMQFANGSVDLAWVAVELVLPVAVAGFAIWLAVSGAKSLPSASSVGPSRIALLAALIVAVATGLLIGGLQTSVVLSASVRPTPSASAVGSQATPAATAQPTTVDACSLLSTAEVGHFMGHPSFPGAKDASNSQGCIWVVNVPGQAVIDRGIVDLIDKGSYDYETQASGSTPVSGLGYPAFAVPSSGDLSRGSGDTALYVHAGRYYLYLFLEITATPPATYNGAEVNAETSAAALIIQRLITQQ